MTTAVSNSIERSIDRCEELIARGEPINDMASKFYELEFDFRWDQIQKLYDLPDVDSLPDGI